MFVCEAVLTYQTKRCHIPEDSDLHNVQRENLTVTLKFVAQSGWFAWDQVGL
jgi:hypothetical protein